MREKYAVEICGVHLNLISDESEEYVNSLVAILNKRVNDLVMTNLRCTKFDAVLLCTLDYLDEKTKLQIETADLKEKLNEAEKKNSEYEDKLAEMELELEELKKENRNFENRSKHKR